jgi:hypothetical protein
MANLVNMKKELSVRFFIFKEKGEKHFTGVCLDFGIVLEGKNPIELKHELETAAIGYLKTIAMEGMSADLLRNQAEKKYFDLYERFLKYQKEKTRNIGIKKFDEILTGFLSINGCACHA